MTAISRSLATGTAALFAVMFLGLAAHALPPEPVVGTIHEGPHEVIGVSSHPSGTTTLTIVGTDHALGGTFTGTSQNA